MTHSFRIELSPSGVGCRVFLDGKDISSLLRGISVQANVGEQTQITLRTTAVDVEIVGEPGEIVTEPPA